MQDNLHWTTASVFLQINERSLREKVARFLGASESLKLDEMCRFAEGRHPGCWSQCTMLVDGFPVFKGQRKDGSNYSGKYKRAALKFECICSLSGVPLCIRGPFPGKQHDSAIFQKFIAFCENTCRKSSFSGEPIYPVCHCQFQRVEKVTRKRQREEETAAAESQ